jgi:hypothetical protein
MSTASLSADSTKLRDVSQKTSRDNELFHQYDFFTCMTFSSVWLFHLYEVFLRMSFSSV